MDGIVGVMRQVARNEVEAILTTELGIVTAVFSHESGSDKDNYQCSVKLKNRKLPDGKDFELRQVPVATPYIGLACIPNVGDLVLVNFIGGNINAPVITGRLYNDEDRPPENKQGEFLLRHTIKEGGSIKLDNQGRVIITSKDEKNTFTVEDGKVSIVNDKFSLVIDVSAKKISIAAEGDLELTAKNGKLRLSAKDVEISADGGVKLSAQQNVEIKATQNVTAEGTSGVTVKNAAAQVAISGPTVNINNGALEVT